jgi:beta-glucosidase
MTLDEKLEQLLNTAPAIPRLGVPAYNWWTESLHGALGALPTTNFPEPIGLAATFDPALVHDVAGAISTEVRDLHVLARATGRMGRIGTGLNTWSPNINIFRDPALGSRPGNLRRGSVPDGADGRGLRGRDAGR